MHIVNIVDKKKYRDLPEMLRITLQAVISVLFYLRRDRDSNPGYALTYNGFQDRRLQPLSHPSRNSLDAL